MITEKMNVPRVIESIRQFTVYEQLDVMQQLAEILRASVRLSPRRSLLELQGLGSEIWRGVRSQEYVDQERATWDSYDKRLRCPSELKRIVLDDLAQEEME